MSSTPTAAWESSAGVCSLGQATAWGRGTGATGRAWEEPGAQGPAPSGKQRALGSSRKGPSPPRGVGGGGSPFLCFLWGKTDKERQKTDRDC